MVRDQVKQLSEMGPIPSSDTVEEEQLIRYELLIREIQLPISDEEATMLCKLFGPDDSFGLAWTLIHIIETAPGWPLSDCIKDTKSKWTTKLRERWEGRPK